MIRYRNESKAKQCFSCYYSYDCYCFTIHLSVLSLGMFGWPVTAQTSFVGISVGSTQVRSLVPRATSKYCRAHLHSCSIEDEAAHYHSCERLCTAILTGAWKRVGLFGDLCVTADVERRAHCALIAQTHDTR